MREWVIISLFLGVFSTALMASSLVKYFQSSKVKDQKIKYCEAFIEINVSGAVISPGVYKLVPGSSLKDVLIKAKLKKTVDRKKLNLSQKLFYSCSVDVPEK